MNYSELEKLLLSSITFSTDNDDDVILNHFKEKHTIVPYNGDIMFVCNHDREFQNNNHLIQLHTRNQGQVPMHIFHYIVLTYIYSGTFKMTVEKQEIVLEEGDIIILDRHVPHSVAATTEKDLGINIILHDHYFSNRYINKLPKDQLITQFMIELMNHQHTHNHYLLFKTQKDHLIHNCIQNILCERFDPMISSDDIIDNYIMILITHLARKGQYNTNLTNKLFKNQELIEQILRYINEHYKEGNLKEMCKHFGYDPSYTSKLIKKHFGKTFKQMVNEERMKKAMILLQNKDIPIYEIAEEIGIHNLTAFYKRFQDFTNLTPQAYRDSNQK